MVSPIHPLAVCVGLGLVACATSTPSVSEMGEPNTGVQVVR